MVMVHVELNGNINEAENTMQVNILPFIHPRPPDVIKRSKQYFSEVGHVAYQIKGKDLYNIMEFYLTHTPDILGWVKKSDIEIVQIRIF